MADMEAEIIVEVSKDLEDLVPEYIESMNTSIIYFEKLIENKNFTELKSEAHKMKGHGGAYGFQYISDMGLLIEGFAREEKHRICRTMADNIRTSSHNL